MDKGKEAPFMRKGVIAILVLAAGLMLVSAVYASFPAVDSKAGQLQSSDINRLKRFQRETFPLRDELITKRLALSREFSKRRLNKERIAALQKTIIDIRTQIQKKADETGIAGQYAGKAGCDWMSKRGIL
jgi:hypothetical protein